MPIIHLFTLLLFTAPSPGLALPRIAPSAPVGALDLGPVLLAEHPSNQALLAEADRLGADVLVYQSQTIADFYPAPNVGKEVAKQTVSILASAAASAIAKSESGHSRGPSYNGNSDRTKLAGFYRAFRLRVEHRPLLLTPPLPGDTLDAQLAQVHCAFASGQLTPSHYEAFRAELLARVVRS